MNYLHEKNQQTCHRLIESSGLMFNIIIIFKKMINLNSEACWTVTEAQIIATCLQVFFNQQESSMASFGLAPLAVYTVEKIQM